MATETPKITSRTSEKFSLDWLDIGKGLLVAVATPVFTVLIETLQKGELTFNWVAIGTTAAAAGLGYLLKNFFQQSQTIITVTPPAESENVKI